MVCVALLNRLKGDAVDSTKEQLAEYESYPRRAVIQLIAETEARAEKVGEEGKSEG